MWAVVLMQLNIIPWSNIPVGFVGELYIGLDLAVAPFRHHTCYSGHRSPYLQ